MPFRSTVSDFQFIMQNVVGFQEVSDTERFADATPDLVNAILMEGAKLCDDTLAQFNAVGDSHPARLEYGIVRMPPGFDEGFRKMAEGCRFLVPNPIRKSRIETSPNFAAQPTLLRRSA